MVNDKRAILLLGMLAAGFGMQQKVIPSAVRFCQHHSGPIRNHHSTFDYDHSILSYSPEEDTIKYSTIMSVIAPKIIINAAKSMVNLPKTRNDTFDRQWKSAFSASPEVCCKLWNKMDPFKMMPTGVDQKHLLWHCIS
jgi:hypothetical protein